MEDWMDISDFDAIDEELLCTDSEVSDALECLGVE